MSFEAHSTVDGGYQTFDVSGQDPFEIVFDPCLRSRAAADNRALILDIYSSAFDVAYACISGVIGF